MNRIDQPPPTLLTGQPRRTEETDTRQALQRHDPEFYKKKKNEDEETAFKDPYEDLAEVSVPALRNFLMGLLDRAPENPPAATQPAAQPKPPTAQQAAASAYQKRSGPPAAAPAPAASAPSALDQAASNLDRAEILDLVRELDRLSAEGIEFIALEKGDGFLGGIRAGINRARNT